MELATSLRTPRFQSTHSLRSATIDKDRLDTFFPEFQSTHSLRSATRGSLPSGGGKEFQSTHSLRSATRVFRSTPPFGKVSIHALLAECDGQGRQTSIFPRCFNPRTPCGVRPCGTRRKIKRKPFQSTHSLRSATTSEGIIFPDNVVSIHALLAECDPLMNVI